MIFPLYLEIYVYQKFIPYCPKLTHLEILSGLANDVDEFIGMPLEEIHVEQLTDLDIM